MLFSEIERRRAYIDGEPGPHAEGGE